MDLTRQKDLLNEEQLKYVNVTLIGAGGIGSPTALVLAKMGLRNIKVYDPDQVEEHNVPNQFYSLESTGEAKVYALSVLVEDMTGVIISGEPYPYEDQLLMGIVISAVDSMETRRIIWEQVKLQQERVPLYIEARMGAEVGIVYTICPQSSRQREFYEQSLYTDGEALMEPCTRRAIIYNTLSIVGLIGAQVKHYIVGEHFYHELILDLVDMNLYKKEVPDD